MKLEILYFDACPSYREAQATLEEVLSQMDVTAEIGLVAVNTDEEAKRLRFPGSPTIRVDGRDLFPGGAKGREEGWLGCRLYATPQGLRGSPTAEMVRASWADRNLVLGVS